MLQEALTVEKLREILNKTNPEEQDLPIIFGSGESIVNPKETGKDFKVVMATKDKRSYFFFGEIPENTAYFGDYEIKQRLPKPNFLIEPGQFIKVTLNEKGLDFFDTELLTRLFFVEEKRTCQKNSEKQVLTGRFLDNNTTFEIGNHQDWRISNYQELTPQETAQATEQLSIIDLKK